MRDVSDADTDDGDPAFAPTQILDRRRVPRDASRRPGDATATDAGGPLSSRKRRKSRVALWIVVGSVAITGGLLWIATR